MTAAEYHQQQLEQQEQEEDSVRLENEDGSTLGIHIWGDSDTVYLNINRDHAMSISTHLTIEQAEVMVKLLDNALRRAKK
jgi:hypothetical protein